MSGLKKMRWRLRRVDIADALTAVVIVIGIVIVVVWLSDFAANIQSADRFK